MKNKPIPIAKPFIDNTDIASVVKVLKSGRLSLGPSLSKFESNFAFYIGVKYACAVSSGTAGLHLVVKALGLKSGDEVITSPFSFIASSNCLLYEGVKPVFIDIDESTFNLDSQKIERAITPRTKAILVVHIFGQSADMNAITRLAKKYKLAIIEDACESIGATYGSKFTGTFGRAGVFAFYPNKQITTGEGGMIVTESKDLYKKFLVLRNQGRASDMQKVYYLALGYNYRMDEMSAALGNSQLKKVNRFIKERRKIAEWYSKFLSDIPGIIIPRTAKNQTHTWFVYVIRITNGTRNQLQQKLLKIGIQTKVYLPSIHLQPFMREQFSYKEGDFPIAEKVSSEALALPLFVGLKKQEIKKISEAIRQNIYENRSIQK